MDRRSFIIGVGAVAAFGLAATEAEAATWVYLGREKVSGLIDHDVINVGPGRGVFSKIKLRVTGNSLLLYDLKVQYGNGAVDDLPVRKFIPQGGYTRDIDLRRNVRFIRNVQFTYGKFFNGRGATYVELWGRR